MASQETFDPINPFHLDSGLDSESRLSSDDYAKKFNKMIYDYFVIEGERHMEFPGIYFVSDDAKLIELQKNGDNYKWVISKYQPHHIEELKKMLFIGVKKLREVMEEYDFPTDNDLKDIILFKNFHRKGGQYEYRTDEEMFDSILQEQTTAAEESSEESLQESSEESLQESSEEAASQFSQNMEAEESSEESSEEAASRYPQRLRRGVRRKPKLSYWKSFIKSDSSDSSFGAKARVSSRSFYVT